MGSTYRMASISAERANFLLIFSFTLSVRIVAKLAVSKLANRTVFSSDLIAQQAKMQAMYWVNTTDRLFQHDYLIYGHLIG